LQKPRHQVFPDAVVSLAPVENRAAPSPDKVEQAVEALEELKADFGVRVLLEAILHSGITDGVPQLNPSATLRVIQYVIREIVYSPDPRLAAEIMAIGAGVLDDKGIMSRIAEKRGITRQAISKHVVAFCEQWNLPPSSAMKSEAARQTYAERNQPRL
jgi:hypothetical protein